MAAKIRKANQVAKFKALKAKKKQRKIEWLGKNEYIKKKELGIMQSKIDQVQLRVTKHNWLTLFLFLKILKIIKIRWEVSYQKLSIFI